MQCGPFDDLQGGCDEDGLSEQWREAGRRRWADRLCEVLCTRDYRGSGRSCGPSGLSAVLGILFMSNFCPLYLIVLRTRVPIASLERAGVMGPESGQKMGLQQAGEQGHSLPRDLLLPRDPAEPAPVPLHGWLAPLRGGS